MDKNISKYQIIVKVFEPEGNFPNNQHLPFLCYKSPSAETYDSIDSIFQQNHWVNSWKNGIFGYHHYHSTAHEVLVILSGTATVQLGGPGGETFDVSAGDILIIPAGVAHKNIDSSSDFSCIGAYPDGQKYDMNYGKPGERPGTDQNISRVPLPKYDPIFGENGPVNEHWLIR